MKRVIVFILAFFLFFASVAGVDEVKEKEVEKPERFKLKWSIMNQLLKLKGLMKRFKLKVPWKFKINRMLSPVIMSVDAVFKGMAVDASAWAKDVKCEGGCWHTEENGSRYSSYQSAVYSEAWGTDVTKAFDVTQLQSIVTNFTPSNTAGSILLKRSTNTIFTLLFSGGNITANGGATIDTYTPDTEITLEMVPDFKDETVVIYIDGSLLSKEDFATGEHCNQLDEIARSGTQTAVGDIKVADTVESSKVIFSDTGHEDNIADYTTAGTGTVTHDATENSYKIYHDGSLNAVDNVETYFEKVLNTPKYNSVITMNIKRGTTDDSTDSATFWVKHESDADATNYIYFSYNGSTNKIKISNIVGDVNSPSSDIAWTPVADTWYEIKVITLPTDAYLFIDGVEYLHITYTKIENFCDGKLKMIARHDANQISEIYCRPGTIEHSPLVVAPRSNPPGLLTSAIRPAVEGTYWDDLAGYWDKKYGDVDTTALGTDGIYGNNIEINTSTQLAVGKYYIGLKYNLDSSVDFSKYHTIRYILETNNITNIEAWNSFALNMAIGYLNYSPTITFTNADKKTIVEIDISNPSGGSGNIALTTGFEIPIRFTTDQNVTFKISDIQLLGGPEHDVRGQKSYSSSGIDDIAEYDTSDSTTVVPIYNVGGSYYDFDDATNAINEICAMKRSLNYNPNGVGHLHLNPEIIATDSSTDYYWVAEIRVDDNNRMFLAWEHNGGAPRLNYRIISGGNSNFSGTVATAKDNNSNTFDCYFHRDHGIALHMNDKMIFSDYSILGTWTDWAGDASISFYTKHDAAERSDSHLHEIGFDRHPLNVHQLQCTELEEITDTLAPSGTPWLDGDWLSGAVVSATGNPINNLKHIEETGMLNNAGFYYELDAVKDLSQFQGYKVRGWLRSTNAGNVQFSIKDHTLDTAYMTYALAANTWTYFEEDVPYSTNPVGDSGWTGEGGVANTYDPTTFEFIVVENKTGGASDISLYGLQFLSSEYDKENFVPVDWEIEDHSLVPTHYGVFYMGPGEKARLYNMQWDGHIWVDQCTIEFLDLWGVGLKGIGTAQAEINSLTLNNETGNENKWAIQSGTWSVTDMVSGDSIIYLEAGSGLANSTLPSSHTVRTVNDADHITWADVIISDGATFGHSTWAPSSDVTGARLFVRNGTFYFPDNSGTGTLIITNEFRIEREGVAVLGATADNITVTTDRIDNFGSCGIAGGTGALTGTPTLYGTGSFLPPFSNLVGTGGVVTNPASIFVTIFEFWGLSDFTRIKDREDMEVI